jgi:hypothetical protein
MAKDSLWLAFAGADELHETIEIKPLINIKQLVIRFFFIWFFIAITSLYV